MASYAAAALRTARLAPDPDQYIPTSSPSSVPSVASPRDASSRTPDASTPSEADGFDSSTFFLLTGPRQPLLCVPLDPSAAASSRAFAPASVSGLASNARILRSSNLPNGPVIAPWSPAFAASVDDVLFLRSNTRFIPRSVECSTSSSRTYRVRHLDVGMKTLPLFAACALGGRRRVRNPIEL